MACVRQVQQPLRSLTAKFKLRDNFHALCLWAELLEQLCVLTPESAGAIFLSQAGDFERFLTGFAQRRADASACGGWRKAGVWMDGWMDG